MGAAIFARPSFPPPHPLAFPRAGHVEALCRALGWLPEGAFVESRPASVAELCRYHDPAYVAAVEQVSREGKVSPEMREQFRLGTPSNPLFRSMFERSATAVGGSMRAARLAWDGRVVFHPPGGTHHGGKDHASGFCFFNDPVFAILEFLRLGARRVAYADFDAHHGDGVEDAFAGDPSVLTISVHEADRWPRTGRLEDRRGGSARNLPVPRGLNDDEFACLIDEAVVPLIARFEPDAVVALTGADALAGDPLAKLALSNGALWRAVEKVTVLAPAAVVLGGGGYHPWNVSRCWTGLWARLAGHEEPSPFPERAQALLGELNAFRLRGQTIDPAWLTTLLDPPRGGEIRDEIRAIAAASVAATP